MKKSQITYQTWLYQEQKPLEEKKTVIKGKLQLNRQGMRLVHRDAKVQVDTKNIGKYQKSIVFFLKKKTFFFQNS